jgi:hypothetical protein
MALLSILTGGRPVRTEFALSRTFKNPQGVVERIPQMFLIDATLQITAQYSAAVTKHPVEVGPDISDHIRVEPVSIQMEGVCSDTPIDLASSVTGLATAALSKVGSAVSGPLGGAVGAVAGGVGASLLASALGGSQSKSQLIRDALISLLTDKVVFDIAAPSLKSEHSKGLVLTKLSFPKGPDTGRAVRFSATMEQIRLVESEVIPIGKIDKSVLHTAAGKANVGKQATATASDGKRKSFLKAFGSILGG